MIFKNYKKLYKELLIDYNELTTKLDNLLEEYRDLRKEYVDLKEKNIKLKSDLEYREMNEYKIKVTNRNYVEKYAYLDVPFEYADNITQSKIKKCLARYVSDSIEDCIEIQSTTNYCEAKTEYRGILRVVV